MQGRAFLLPLALATLVTPVPLAGCVCSPPSKVQKTESPSPRPTKEQASTHEDAPLPEDAFVERVLAFNAHITVLKGSAHFADYATVLDKASEAGGTVAAQPFIMMEMRHEAREQTIMVKGVDPTRWTAVMGVAKFLTKGSPELSWPQQSKKLPPALIGYQLADEHELGLGDTFRLEPRATDPSLPPQPAMKGQEFRVTGLFRMTFEEYDQRLVIIPLRAAQDIHNQGDKVMGIELRVRDLDQARTIAKNLQQQLGDGFQAIDWCELNYLAFADRCSPKEAISGTRAVNRSGCDARQWGSCVRLGLMWEYGQDGSQDRARARTLYEKACAAKESAGCTRLGLLWLFGRGGAVNLTKARSLFKTACSAGSMRGCGEFAGMLETGQGGTTDAERANHLYDKACAGGEARACMVIARAFTERGDSTEARRRLETGCAGNSEHACEQLAMLLSAGLGGTQDKKRSAELLAKAKRLYKENCDKGYPHACHWMRLSAQ
jgi:TPR repeat protein